MRFQMRKSLALLSIFFVTGYAAGVHGTPEQQKGLYKRKWRVGVVEFQNRTGIEHGPQTDLLAIVAPKLGVTASTSLADVLANLEAVEVFARTEDEVKKILREWGCVQRGFVEPLVQFGKLTGLTHIAAGSIDYIKLKYVSRSELQSTAFLTGVILSLIAGAALTPQKEEGEEVKIGPKGALVFWGGFALTYVVSSALGSQQGWDIEIGITVTVINVETGKILLSHQLKGKDFVKGPSEEANSLSILGAAQKVISRALHEDRYEIARKLMYAEQ